MLLVGFFHLDYAFLTNLLHGAAHHFFHVMSVLGGSASG
jgi:hypothetical protein